MLAGGFSAAARSPGSPLAARSFCRQPRRLQFGFFSMNWVTFASTGGTKHLPYVTFGNPCAVAIRGTVSK